MAHIRLAGELEEGPPEADSFFNLGAENFKTKLDRIKKARKERQSGPLPGDRRSQCRLGAGSMNCAQAIADVRKGGKKVYAYLESADTRDYLLALACDEVCLPESGWLMLTGIRAEVTFYKELFEKIGVQADMLQMGDSKGAAEPYTRTSMSERRPQATRQACSTITSTTDLSSASSSPGRRQET